MFHGFSGQAVTWQAGQRVRCVFVNPLVDRAWYSQCDAKRLELLLFRRYQVNSWTTLRWGSWRLSVVEAVWG